MKRGVFVIGLLAVCLTGCTSAPKEAPSKDIWDAETFNFGMERIEEKVGSELAVKQLSVQRQEILVKFDQDGTAQKARFIILEDKSFGVEKSGESRLKNIEPVETSGLFENVDRVKQTIGDNCGGKQPVSVEINGHPTRKNVPIGVGTCGLGAAGQVKVIDLNGKQLTGKENFGDMGLFHQNIDLFSQIVDLGRLIDLTITAKDGFTEVVIGYVDESSKTEATKFTYRNTDGEAEYSFTKFHAIDPPTFNIADFDQAILKKAWEDATHRLSGDFSLRIWRAKSDDLMITAQNDQDKGVGYGADGEFLFEF